MSQTQSNLQKKKTRRLVWINSTYTSREASIYTSLKSGPSSPIKIYVCLGTLPYLKLFLITLASQIAATGDEYKKVRESSDRICGSTTVVKIGKSFLMRSARPVGPFGVAIDLRLLTRDACGRFEKLSVAFWFRSWRLAGMDVYVI